MVTDDLCFGYLLNWMEKCDVIAVDSLGKTADMMN